MTRVSVAFLAALMLASAVSAQQHADTKYVPHVARPAYASAAPVVAVDQSHNNFHTLDGKYAPFGQLLTADGYQVRPLTGPFAPSSLQGVTVLVIANARGPVRGASAFTSNEIATIRAWVGNGGSLLLISDHAPFGTAAASLADAFGVEMGTGFAIVRDAGRISSQILFLKCDLGRHPITEGRDIYEAVHSVESFTGQSLSVPAGATALLVLPPDALEVASADDINILRRGGGVPARSAGGRAQALAMPFGKGRVVIAGEAAMFTEQIISGLGRVGLRDHDDQQFALNAMHWLSRLIGD